MEPVEAVESAELVEAVQIEDAQVLENVEVVRNEVAQILDAVRQVDVVEVHVLREPLLQGIGDVHLRRGLGYVGEVGQEQRRGRDGAGPSSSRDL